VADIRSFLKAKEEREQKRDSYSRKIARHRRTFAYRVLVVAAIIIALILIVYYQYRNRVFTDYEMVSTLAQNAVTQSTDIRLGNCVLTYSKDGAHCTNQKGEILWNQTYDIQDILLSVNGDVAAIATYGGRNVYVQSAAKILGQFTTNMPIQNMTVAGNGNVAVTMADTENTYLYIYDTAGTLLYEGEVTMSGSGYPVAVSLSPSGELLMISYLQPDTDTIKSHIAFYNLGEVGDNHADNDRLVSAYNYGESVIPYVQFFNNSQSFALSDSRLIFFSGTQTPESNGEYLLTDREVRSICHSENYVGLVFYADQAETADELYQIEVYNNSGKAVGIYGFSIEYTDIFFQDDTIVIYNETQCLVLNMEGDVKYEGSFTKPVRLMLPGSGTWQYQVVTNDSIDTIQLK
jgi:hypothetical protein